MNKLYAAGIGLALLIGSYAIGHWIGVDDGISRCEAKATAAVKKEDKRQDAGIGALNAGDTKHADRVRIVIRTVEKTVDNTNCADTIMPLDFQRSLGVRDADLVHPGTDRPKADGNNTGPKP